MAYYVTNWWGQGVVFLSTPTPEPVVHTGQFYLWSPLMIFALIMAIIVGLIILSLLVYALFYFCMYGTCCCPGFGCFWCPQTPAAAPEEGLKVRIRRPSAESCRSSCRSSVRSTRSGCSHRDYEDRKMVRINSCPSINESMGGPQPIIIQTIPAPQPSYQPQPMQYAPPPMQYAPPPVQYAPPPPAPSFSGGGELRVVIGDARPASNKSSSGNVIVYDMGRSNGGGVSLGGGGGGGGRSEYTLTSVNDHGGYRSSGNDGFDRDDGGSFMSDGHRSAIIDIGKGGGGHSFYPSLPQYDD